MSGALGAPGPGRFAAADAVVRADPTVRVGDEPVDVGAGAAPACRRCRPRRVDSRRGARRRRRLVPGRRLGRRRTPPAAERLRGHGWQSAALTPYRLIAGRAPSSPRDVVADARLGVRVGDSVRVVAPGGDAPYRVSGVAAGSAGRGRPVLRAAPSPGRCPARRGRRRDRRRRAHRPRRAARADGRRRRGARRRARLRGRRRRPAHGRARHAGRESWRRWPGSPARWRCSSWPALSPSRSPSAGARPPSCGARRDAAPGAPADRRRGADRARSLAAALGVPGRPSARAGDRSTCSSIAGSRREGFALGELVDPAGRRRRARHRDRPARRGRGRAPRRPGRARPRRCARSRSSTAARACSSCSAACSASAAASRWR